MQSIKKSEKAKEVKEVRFYITIARQNSRVHVRVSFSELVEEFAPAPKLELIEPKRRREHEII